MRIGYTAGVYDLFHIGHLNILKEAKKRCDYLIVAVSTDELVKEYKGKIPVIPYQERMQIVEAIKYVDEVVPQNTRNKKVAYDRYQFDVMFVGDDWKGDCVFEEVNDYMISNGKEGVVYLPHTPNISSTLLTEVIKKMYEDA